MNPKPDTLNRALWGCIVLGVVLAILNALSNRSLWIDEASLALNIVEKSAADLLAPLEKRQVAPIGFLMVEKFTAELGGNTDWSLRIFPLISFFASVVLFYLLCCKIIPDETFALFVTAYYCLSYFIIAYSWEAKQYMSDVTICLAILLGSIRVNKSSSSRQLLLYAAIGSVAIWFSNIAVILLFTGGLYALYQRRISQKRYLPLLLVIGAWCFSFTVYYILFIHDHPSRASMINYWDTYGAFLPYNVFSKSFFASLLNKVVAFFSPLGLEVLSVGAIPFFAVGVLKMKKTNAGLLFLLVAPILAHLLLCYFKFYPFATRLILYYYPILLLLFLGGFYHLISRLQNRTLSNALLLMPLLLNFALLNVRGFPIKKEEIKESLAYVNSKIAHGEELYVYHPASRAFSFYRSGYPRIDSLEYGNIIIGKPSNHDRNNYIPRINKIKGPVWILFSHVLKANRSPDGISDETFILGVFKSNGFEVTDQQNFRGSSVYRATPGTTE